jgi:hypothetical protein
MTGIDARNPSDVQDGTERESPILTGAKEALAIVRGEAPAPRVFLAWHYYVPEAERDALQAEIDRLREALKPFAEMTDTECDFDIAPHMDWFESRERARAALNKEGA